MIITYNTYYKIPNYMASIHDQLYKKFYGDPSYNPEGNTINYNVYFDLISTDER